MTVACHPELTAKLVDVIRTKALYTPHMPVFSSQDNQARDDNIMARWFGMAELQQRIGGRSVSDDAMDAFV